MTEIIDSFLTHAGNEVRLVKWPSGSWAWQIQLFAPGHIYGSSRDMVCISATSYRTEDEARQWFNTYLEDSK